MLVHNTTTEQPIIILHHVHTSKTNFLNTDKYVVSSKILKYRNENLMHTINARFQSEDSQSQWLTIVMLLPLSNICSSFVILLPSGVLSLKHIQNISQSMCWHCADSRQQTANCCNPSMILKCYDDSTQTSASTIIYFVVIYAHIIMLL